MTVHSAGPIFFQVGTAKGWVIFSNFSFCLLCMIVTMDQLPHILVHILFQLLNMHHYGTDAASRGDLFLQRKNTDLFVVLINSVLWSKTVESTVPIRDSQSASVFRSQVRALFLSHYVED